MIDGILWILNTGAQWRDLPGAFGGKATVWEHFDRWNADGTLDAVFDRFPVFLFSCFTAVTRDTHHPRTRCERRW